jgi:hypothetical protein
MPIYSYHGTFKPTLYYNFSFEIEADSTEDANAKAEEYFKNEANHGKLVMESEVDDIENDIRYLKYYFLENAQVDSAFREAEENEEEDEEIHVCMSVKE